MNDLRDLYEEIILDHNRNPRNYRRQPAHANRSARGYNPLCGDDVKLSLTVDGDTIRDIAFDGRGCAISTASASLMTEALKGRTRAEAEAVFAAMHTLLTNHDAQPDEETLGELIALGGVKAFPMRVKCATLAWHTLQAALANDDNTVTTE